MHHRAAYTYLLLTALFWGGNAVAGKLAVGNVSPMLLVALRWSIAVTILAVIGWRQVRADWPVIRGHYRVAFSLRPRNDMARLRLALADQYQHRVVNDTVAEAVDEICQILQDRGLLND